MKECTVEQLLDSLIIASMGYATNYELYRKNPDAEEWKVRMEEAKAELLRRLSEKGEH